MISGITLANFRQGKVEGQYESLFQKGSYRLLRRKASIIFANQEKGRKKAPGFLFKPGAVRFGTGFASCRR
jgi:hypothetical protein